MRYGKTAGFSTPRLSVNSATNNTEGLAPLLSSTLNNTASRDHNSIKAKSYHSTIDLQFRAPVKPGDTISSKLVVKDKKTEGGKDILVCDMFISNDKGDCVEGSAEIVA